MKPVVLTDEELESYDMYELQRQLDKAKSAVFLGPDPTKGSEDAAFFGPMMCSLDFVWAKGLDTAANDGKRFYWDPVDFLRCSPEERRSTIMHELWHIARLHSLRRGNRCPDVWNIACDVVINRHLRLKGWAVGHDWVDRRDLDHVEMEEDIYDLLQKPGGKPMPQPGNQPGQTPSHAHGAGKCNHAQIALSAQDKQNVVNTAVKAVQAAKLSNQAGAIPGGTETILDKFLAPKINWKQQLQQFFLDMEEEDFTWSRPNRRHSNIYLPSRFMDDGRLDHLIYGLDVSGSVTDPDVLRFHSEVAYIKREFNPRKLTLVQFDTRITKIVVFEEDDPFEEMVIVGRGGTDLTELRQYIVDQKPTAAVVFSDLYCSAMEPGPTCPMLWVVVGNKQAKVNFGKMIHIGNERGR